MLLEKLLEHANSDTYPMHMPGHKRNAALLGGGLPYDIDITEIDGFDNLQNPDGILLEVAELAAELYGSEKAFPLVGGSTAGLLAAIGASTRRGDTLLVARNCHMSVYNAAALFGLKTEYIIPKFDSVSGVACSIEPEAVRRALDLNPDVKLIVITSPTYEGVVSDVAAISDIAHGHGIPLLVDSAHGAHLGFSGAFPESAVNAGADITVMSLHKTLPALTQCALLHVRGGFADLSEITRQLPVFQTSSPSYVLLASLDRCLRLLSRNRETFFGNYEEKLKQFDESAKELNRLSVLCHGADSGLNHPGFYGFDPGKIVIATRKSGLTGFQLMKLLRDEYKIELEASGTDYALAMTSICDSAGGFTRLAAAISEIDCRAEPAVRIAAENPPPPSQVMTLADALNLTRDGHFAQLKDAAGLVSLEYVWCYPPGAPIIAPGEAVSAVAIEYIASLAASGANIKSTWGHIPDAILAIRKRGAIPQALNGRE